MHPMEAVKDWPECTVWPPFIAIVTDNKARDNILMKEFHLG